MPPDEGTAHPTLLVTTDTSPLGDHALAHAQALAAGLGAELCALLVLPDPLPAVADGIAYLPPMSEGDLLAERRGAEEKLAARVPGARVRVERATGRPIPGVILGVARDEDARLIVMSTHGRSGLSRALLGSVAEGVAHHSPVPVLLVRAHHPVTPWSASRQAEQVG
ncbi:universal stress protein [Deinococcus planocerae]|uniref:universal stress protein n=1 Tax=Deinococcus planocerae TaxID=1737569 RepID=UPI000C7E90A6|nr:universal stress protein [Deinococcus planocerae]